MPLTCDARSLRVICKAPDGLFDEQRGAVILPTRDCLRTHARRTMQAALNQYGIGPVAQVIFAPVLVVAEAETVDGLDRLRDAALFNYWLFEYADLPLERKREIASAELERWGGTIEAAAAEVTRTADDLAATASDQPSRADNLDSSER